MSDLAHHQPPAKPASEAPGDQGTRDGVAKVTAPTPEAGPHPRRFLALLVAISLVGCSLVLATNYVVDPRNRFPTEVYRPLLDDVYDDLLTAWEEETSQNASAGPTVVVFGPSTGRRLLPDDIEAAWGSGAFNFATPGSGPEDYVLIYDYMVRQGRPPAEIIVSVDDFQLLDVPWNSALLPSSQAYERVTGHGPPLSYILGELQASFTPGYLYGSFRVLLYTHVTGYPPEQEAGVPAQNAEGLGELLAPDVRALFEAQYEPTVRPDPSKGAALEALVEHAVANGTAVTLFLPPVHPEVLALLEQEAEYARVHGGALALAGWACREGASAYDYTHVADFGGDADAFEDAWHYSSDNGLRIIEALRAGRGELCRPAVTS